MIFNGARRCCHPNKIPLSGTGRRALKENLPTLRRMLMLRRDELSNIEDYMCNDYLKASGEQTDQAIFI